MWRPLTQMQGQQPVLWLLPCAVTGYGTRMSGLPRCRSGLNLSGVKARGNGWRGMWPQTVDVRLRQVDGAAVVIAAVVDAGGDAVRLNGLEPGFSDEAAVAAKARQAAWQDALRSAEQLALLASAALGQVLSVTEHGRAPGSVPMASMQRASAVDSFPIQPGQAQVDAAVTVVWELQPGPRP